MKEKKYIPTWVIVVSAILVSCVISGICCVLIFQPELPQISLPAPSQTEQTEVPADNLPSAEPAEGDDSVGGTQSIDESMEQDAAEPVPETNGDGTKKEGSEPTADAEGPPEESASPEPSVQESEAEAAPAEDADAEHETTSNGVVSDLGGDGGKNAKYKIETVEVRVRGLPCTVYARYCKRNTFSGDWEIVEEIGDPYYGTEKTSEKDKDPLSDVTFFNVDDHSIARGERCGYCWYGNSFFEAREQWLFFSGGRFYTAEELEQEEAKWKSRQGF